MTCDLCKPHASNALLRNCGLGENQNAQPAASSTRGSTCGSGYDGTDAPGTARGYCKAPYRLQPTTLDEAIVLRLGQQDGGVGATCP